ncbi:helix-turn-helix transcriptional regulator [Alloactinosynnema sp. L-07]|uniref:ArsR/SmtB family transcription factor n=1 Tax=Alloactinosynnema sp. L-07 TaxID=1653480 RepID=UPI001E4EE590|nr:winged helix-turn-helix domain-containing protein [Alloactinosynnema sp. L-07]
MTGAAELAAVAGLLSDETRAGFCLALLDGRAWTAGELARSAGVARSTASEHLDKLVRGGLLVEERQGRHRYVRLADTSVASLVEQLVSRTAPTAAPSSLRVAIANRAMAAARTCYDHLAGTLGVALTDAMAERQLLDRDADLALTAQGGSWLVGELGIDPDALRSKTRPTARACLDWTERRPHLAGAAGAALCTALMEREWVVRVGSSRAVRLTASGAGALDRLLDVRMPHE